MVSAVYALSKEICWFQVLQDNLLFSSRRFMVLGLMLGSMICIKYNFCVWWGIGDKFTVVVVLLCPRRYPTAIQQRLFKRLSFVYWMNLAPCCKSIGCICVGLFLHSLFCSDDSMPICVPTLHDNFIVSLEIRELESPKCVLFFSRWFEWFLIFKNSVPF